MNWALEAKVVLVVVLYFLGMSVSYILVCVRKWYCTILGLAGFYVTFRGLWHGFGWIK